MLPNKFDQYFRDKLLDHSTKVSPNTWKLIHAGLLRHKAFHFWKWYVAGPTVVVVAVTSHIILAQLNRPANARTGTSVHTTTQPTTTQPTATPAQTAAASEATSPAATTPAATSPAGITPAATSPFATPASDHNAAPETVAASTAPTTASTPKTHSSSVTNGTATKLHTTSGNGSAKISPTTRNHTRHGPGSPSEAGLLGLQASSTKDPGRPQNRRSGSRTAAPASLLRSPTDLATQPAGLATQPARLTARPAGPTSRPAIARPAIRLAVTVQTPNPRSPKNLIVPATPYYHTSKWRFDGYASPEYFSSSEFGFSYGAGARATFVIKQHFTITTGLQYLKVDVRANKKVDSLNGFYPGIFNNIQVPLLLGYTTGNRRFSVSVNAGAIFSLYADAKGLLKYYGWPNHNGTTSYLGFNFATRVNDRISLFAEPYIKCWYPQKFQDLPPQLFSTGISVGLRFDLK